MIIWDKVFSRRWQER